jgi:hypothetical protein
MKFLRLISGILVMFLLIGDFVFAQCQMCKANVISSEEGMQIAGGLNTGIIYMLAIPYLIFIGFAIMIFRSIRRRKKMQV